MTHGPAHRVKVQRARAHTHAHPTFSLSKESLKSLREDCRSAANPVVLPLRLAAAVQLLTAHAQTSDAVNIPSVHHTHLTDEEDPEAPRRAEPLRARGLQEHLQPRTREEQWSQTTAILGRANNNNNNNSPFKLLYLRF